jgi:hypothetical protein
MLCHPITGTGYGTGRYRTGFYSSRMDTIEWTFTTRSHCHHPHFFLLLHIFSYCYIYTFCTNSPLQVCILLSAFFGMEIVILYRRRLLSEFPIRCDDRYSRVRMMMHDGLFHLSPATSTCHLSTSLFSNPSYVIPARLSCVRECDAKPPIC